VSKQSPTPSKKSQVSIRTRPKDLPSIHQRANRSSFPGVQNINTSLPDQLVTVTGTAAPSSILSALQSTGRDAILRGSGNAPDSAAVCILETYASGITDPVRGLARLVQLTSPMSNASIGGGRPRSIVDLSVRGVSPGTYEATVRETGDVSQGVESVGPVWGEKEARREGGRPRGWLGEVTVKSKMPSTGGVASLGSVASSIMWEKDVGVMDIVGRSIVLAKVNEQKLKSENEDALVGVVARSAGVWGNDKTVCSCTGKTVWEERKDQVDRGML